MENHPIPQDVTGFQFKLIGDMTVKQFAYLAGGVITGWIFFSLPLPLLLKIPIVTFFILLGISLAFLPIAGRPLDLMLVNFLKALFSPTQFVYQKTSSNLLFPKQTFNFKVKKQKNVSTPPSLQQQKVFLQTLPKIPQNKFSTPPHIVSASFQEQPKKPQVEEPKQQPQDATEMLKRKALFLEQELEEAKKEELNAQQQPVSLSSGVQQQKVLELEKQLEEVLREKEKLAQQLISLQQKLGAQKQDVYTPTTATLKRETRNVRKIPRGLGKAIGLPILPDVPNLITGIVKNPRGQPLPNILVEVKDSNGNAVRAFKTNGLGQFASATPLINGVYTLTFEDATKQNKFDTIEFTASGEVIMPLEAISVDSREELRKSLFDVKN